MSELKTPAGLAGVFGSVWAPTAPSNRLAEVRHVQWQIDGPTQPMEGSLSGKEMKDASGKQIVS
jgi:hypothetical protein